MLKSVFTPHQWACKAFNLEAQYTADGDVDAETLVKQALPPEDFERYFDQVVDGEVMVCLNKDETRPELRPSRSMGRYSRFVCLPA